MNPSSSSFSIVFSSCKSSSIEYSSFKSSRYLVKYVSKPRYSSPVAGENNLILPSQTRFLNAGINLAPGTSKVKKSDIVLAILGSAFTLRYTSFFLDISIIR